MLETLSAFLNTWALPLAVALPVIAVLPIALLGERRKNLREASIFLFSGLTFALVVWIYWQYHAGIVLSNTLWTIMPGLTLSFNAEALGLIFALIASFLWIVATSYCIGYMRGNNEKHQTRFYICFAISICSALGMAFSANMLTMFIFYELMTLCTYPLVTHHQTQESRNAGRMYLGTLMGLSILLLLPAMLGIWYLTGTLDFTTGGILAGKASNGIIALLLFMCVYGIAKAALMPAHRWLPAAMVAPTPVSALLHAVAVVKAGVFCILKVAVYIFGFDTLYFLSHVSFFHGGWLMYMAGFTVLTASFIALRQDNLKRRLAYSTVSQLSYIILALSVFSPKALIGAAFHIAAHAFGKITLFFAAGSIYTASKKKNVSELGGIGRRMPWTMAAFAIGAFSMIGVPPAMGFLSKWYMLQGAFAAEKFFAVAVIVISTILNAMYYLPIIVQAFFGAELVEAGKKPKEHGEAPRSMVIAMTVTAAGVIVLFLWPDVFLGLAKAVGQ